MVRFVSNVFSSWLLELRRDLAPFAGRWEQSWRIALLCALMTLVSMTYGIPAAVLSCYVLFFVMKSDAAESMVLAVALVILVSIVVFGLIGLINLTIDSPAARLAALVISSLFFLFLGVASALGPLGGIIALVLAFVLTLLAYVPVGELATRAVLYAWLMTAAPMGLLLAFSLVFGRKPKDVLVAEIKARLELAALGLTQQVPLSALSDDLALGLEAQQKRLKWLALFHLAPKTTQQHLGRMVVESYQLLLQAFLLLKKEPSLPHTAHTELALKCKAMAVQVDTESTTSFVIPEEKSSFFMPDAFTNPSYQHTAIKATGAATLCYLIYSGIGWEGIHTAMITCYVAALGSTGETVNKLLLRIVGCLIGAALGLLFIFFFVPYATSIGTLMIIVFLVSFLAAWVSLGSERVSYAGIQIAFAFLLISLDGSGPSIDISTARDRIIGILLGNSFMYIAFTQIWPYSIMQSVERRAVTIETKLQKLAALVTAQPLEAVVCAATIANELHEVNYEFSLVALEPKKLRPTAIVLSDYQQRLATFNYRFEQLALGLAAPS